ncbi:ras association domain-containing protein 4 [Ambystoma mexicanum]|uniref:ras association domain-containing protein 4 n=1 Tax=Ambystoma mexicanum TaxID=8296 RepID=UPI0037E80BCC
MMEDSSYQPSVRVSSTRSILRSELMNLLRTYNCYQEGTSFQLRQREVEGELIIEGLLNISWGLRRPIRLQMHDDNERLSLPPPGLWKMNTCEVNRNMDSYEEEKSPFQESNNNTHSKSDSVDTSCSCRDEVPRLMRTRSDASFTVLMRTKYRSPGETRKMKRHRFSINGHFYNHKTSVFTPAYGSVTNVRVNSTMTTTEVLALLLQKFRVENDPAEFALYMVHESGEMSKLKGSEYPLISRIMHGPCEKIAKMFLMETDLGEEVTHDVAQYIKLAMPVLDSFVEKLKEEEEREISKLTVKFHVLRSVMLQRLEELQGNRDYA